MLFSQYRTDKTIHLCPWSLQGVGLFVCQRERHYLEERAAKIGKIILVTPEANK